MNFTNYKAAISEATTDAEYASMLRRVSEKKLIFIMPTVVRPDLPASPARRGYFIPDRTGVNQ